MILIVDDRPENIFALESILRMNDFKVDTATSGEEALKKVLKNTYSLIILDVQMPGMDGFEVAEIILGHNRSKHIPIMFLSAISKEKKFITRGFESGGIDYITKPVDPDILMLRVKSLYSFSKQRQELTNTKNELAQRVSELHTILEAMPQIAFSMNNAGKIEYTNQSWTEYIGPTDHFPSMISDHEKWEAAWQEAFSEGRQFDHEVALYCPRAKENHHYLMKIVPVIQEKRIIKWIGTLMDIHEQKTANEQLERKVSERTRELRKKNEELELSNSELQQFAWVISHDLKEPVRKILTFSNLIKDRYFKDAAKGKKEIERIIFSTERMSKLIDDLLSFTRLSAQSRYVQTDLNDLVDQVLSDFELVIQEKNAVIHREELCTIEAIPTQMKQVLQNLIGNALKFTRPDIQPEVSIRAFHVSELDFEALPDRDGHYCRIEVADNGIGFDEKYLPKIFQVFQRLGNETSIEGTGIGLAIAKKSLDKHHAIITAKSSANTGSTFIIIIPIKQN